MREGCAIHRRRRTSRQEKLRLAAAADPDQQASHNRLAAERPLRRKPHPKSLAYDHPSNRIARADAKRSPRGKCSRIGPEFQCAGFRAETGAASGRTRPRQSRIFKDLAIWRGRQRWQIGIRNAWVVGSIPISGNLIKYLRVTISSLLHCASFLLHVLKQVEKKFRESCRPLSATRVHKPIFARRRSAAFGKREGF
jgi:hypothetical protein